MMTFHEDVMGKIAPLRRVEDSIRRKIKVFLNDKRDTLELAQAADVLDRLDTAMFGWIGPYHDQTMSAVSSNMDLLKQHLQSLESRTT